MKIKPFAVEEWMNKWETGASYNIAETCVDSISIRELFDLTGEDLEQFLNHFCERRMTYGAIEGAPDFKKGICGLYRTLKPEHIVPTHGAAGANHHIFYSLLSPGDRVVSVMPTYQQLYSIPESYGADVRIVKLKKENNDLPNLSELRDLAAPGTKMICINNPNNPTGALMDETYLLEIVEIARKADAYLLCDEVYRHLGQDDAWCPSVADLYEKGISVSSMSKVFSLAGLRLGWIATRDKSVIQSVLSHRDYDLISCGMFDEAVAAVALSHKNEILARNRGIVRENLAVLDRWIKNNPHFDYIKPAAGTTALIYYDFSKDSYAFCEELYQKTGALVTPGDCFEEPHSFRIGYGCSRNELRAGLAAVSTYADSLTHARYIQGGME